MYIKGQGVGAEKEFPKVENELRGSLSGMHDRLKSTVCAENARYGYSPGAADSGMTELARAVGVQSAGINSLVKQKQSIANARPIVLMLNGRELGRAVVDVGAAETVRTGVKVTGGAK